MKAARSHITHRAWWKTRKDWDAFPLGGAEVCCGSWSCKNFKLGHSTMAAQCPNYLRERTSAQHCRMSLLAGREHGGDRPHQIAQPSRGVSFLAALGSGDFEPGTASPIGSLPLLMGANVVADGFVREQGSCADGARRALSRPTRPSPMASWASRPRPAPGYLQQPCVGAQAARHARFTTGRTIVANDRAADRPRGRCARDTQ